MRKCIYFLEGEEKHNSWEELSSPPPYSLGVRGSSSMSYLTSVNQVSGKDFIYDHHDIFTMYLHFLTTHVQGISLRGGTLSYWLHGLLRAMRNDDVDNSLEDFGEMMYYSWCASLTPTIIHFLQACKKNGATNKWWGKHLLYHIL